MSTNLTLQVVGASLAWIGVTVLAYAAGLAIQRLARGAALANPTLLAIAIVAAALALTKTPYADYFRFTWPITVLLGPATVALGLPLAEHMPQVRRSVGAVALGLAAGSLAAMISGVVLVRLLGGSPMLALSMLPKAATTPIAIEVARQIGGSPAMAAALAVLGGILAATCLQAVLRRLGIADWRAIGLAAGTAGSGIAAARVAPLDSQAAAFAAVGIGLNGLFTALLGPALAALVR